MQCLIDGDLIAYRSAASCEKQGVVTEPFQIAQARANESIHQICQRFGGDPHIILSGGENFRYKINPQYKANRTEQKRPDYLEPLREWLVVEYGAEITDGIEADDRLGILATEYTKADVPFVICSLDKDLRQIPGRHYSWEISGTNREKTWVKEALDTVISPQEGMFNFYWQMVMGDRADNIFGFDGVARQKVPKFLTSMYLDMQTMDEDDLFHFVHELYQNNDNEEVFLPNGQCLWILRNEGEYWLDHLNTTPLMEVLGLKDDSIPS